MYEKRGSAASAAQKWVERAGVTRPGDWGLASSSHRLFLPMLQR